jgi:hypothetical protein
VKTQPENYNQLQIKFLSEHKLANKLNESKSVHVAFTNKIRQQPIFINATQVAGDNTAKYLGMNLHAKLE